MVSIVLLSNEEVLQRNGFWYCLDSVWITEELEPFEETKVQDLFSKPLSRDFYYAKFPEIPRSESEDENSMTLNGFKSKHREWKSKICIKRFYAQKRYSCNSRSSLSGVFTTSSPSLNVRSGKVTSGSGKSRVRTISESGLPATSNNNRKCDFVRIQNSGPPPPTLIITEATIIEPQEQENDCNESELPDYADFEKHKSNLEHLQPTTSTFKRKKRRVSFDLNTYDNDFDYRQFWNESLYGVSEFGNRLSIINSTESNECVAKNDDLIEARNDSFDDHSLSWTEIINECGASESLLNKESWTSTEELVSWSHNAEKAASQFFPEEDDYDDETTYARFAIYKIHQTLTIENGMTDSSPMRDFFSEVNGSIEESQEKIYPTFQDKVYRIAPNSLNEETSTL